MFEAVGDIPGHVDPVGAVLKRLPRRDVTIGVETILQPGEIDATTYGQQGRQVVAAIDIQKFILSVPAIQFEFRAGKPCVIQGLHQSSCPVRARHRSADCERPVVNRTMAAHCEYGRR